MRLIPFFLSFHFSLFVARLTRFLGYQKECQSAQIDDLCASRIGVSTPRPLTQYSMIAGVADVWATEGVLYGVREFRDGLSRVYQSEMKTTGTENRFRPPEIPRYHLDGRISQRPFDNWYVIACRGLDVHS